MFSRVGLALAVALALPALAHAQSYPTRPVRFLIPFPPGGNTDVQGRLIAQKLSALWGQQVVDNRAGAGGTLGVKAAFAADGTEPAGGTAADLERSIRVGMAKWGRLVRELGVKL